MVRNSLAGALKNNSLSGTESTKTGMVRNSLAGALKNINLPENGALRNTDKSGMKNTRKQLSIRNI
jgi:hypothetical protein